MIATWPAERARRRRASGKTAAFRASGVVVWSAARTTSRFRSQCVPAPEYVVTRRSPM
jgi:hypothetical protein